MIKKSSCCWCGTEVKIELPDDPRMRKMVESLSAKCACNSCGEYHSKRTQLAKGIVENAEFLGRVLNPNLTNTIRGDLLVKITTLISLTQDHYLLPTGKAGNPDELFSLITSDPTKAAQILCLLEKLAKEFDE